MRPGTGTPADPGSRGGTSAPVSRAAGTVPGSDPRVPGSAVGSRGSRLGLLIGGVLVALVVVLALVSYVWTPYDALDADTAARLQGPSPQHWLGTDQFGRDTLTWIMEGARVTLLVGIVGVCIAGVLGTPLGVLAAMTPYSWVDTLVMRANDVLLAFPALLLAMVFAAIYGPGTVPAMVAIGIASVPGFARVARSSTLQVTSREYVLAARSANATTLSIAGRHVVPNIAGMTIVQASVTFALAILAEAGLSFLGLGTQPPVPSWGRMLQDSQQFLSTHPGLALWPGLCIALAVLGFNLLGDGLRDRYDPRLAKGRS